MAFWKTRQQRIGVFTSDVRKLESAIVQLDRFEDRINKLKDKPYSMDEYSLEKLIKTWANARASQISALYDRGDDIGKLKEVAKTLEEKGKKCDPYSQNVTMLLKKILCLAEAEACKEEADLWKTAPNP